MKRLHLPRFAERLKVLRKELPAGTFWRYQTGQVGVFGRLLAQYPALAEAYADDVRNLATVDEISTEELTQ